MISFNLREGCFVSLSELVCANMISSCCVYVSYFWIAFWKKSSLEKRGIYLSLRQCFDFFMYNSHTPWKSPHDRNWLHTSSYFQEMFPVQLVIFSISSASPFHFIIAWPLWLASPAACFTPNMDILNFFFLLMSPDHGQSNECSIDTIRIKTIPNQFLTFYY